MTRVGLRPCLAARSRSRTDRIRFHCKIDRSRVQTQRHGCIPTFPSPTLSWICRFQPRYPDDANGFRPMIQHSRVYNCAWDRFDNSEYSYKNKASYKCHSLRIRTDGQLRQSTCQNRYTPDLFFASEFHLQTKRILSYSAAPVFCL